MQVQLRARQAELRAELMHVEAELARVRIQHRSFLKCCASSSSFDGANSYADKSSSIHAGCVQVTH